MLSLVNTKRRESDFKKRDLSIHFFTLIYYMITQIKLYSLLFLSTIYFSNLKAQCNIDFTKQFQIIVNDTVFKNGHLDIIKLSEAIGDSYKTKRTNKRGISYYNYQFKTYPITMLSSFSKRKVSHCRKIRICFNKKRNENFSFTFFGQQINNETNFDAIFNNKSISPYIDFDIYAYPDNPAKSIIHLRFEGYSVWFYFDLSFNNCIEKSRILIFFKPKFN